MAPTQPRETEPQPSFGARLATHNSQLTAIYMKTRLPHNFHFRIKYLTVTRPVDKMYNTQTHPQQNQILKCQTPTPGVRKKNSVFPERPHQPIAARNSARIPLIVNLAPADSHRIPDILRLRSPPIRAVGG